jgi:hypothetical protein
MKDQFKMTVEHYQGDDNAPTSGGQVLPATYKRHQYEQRLDKTKDIPLYMPKGIKQELPREPLFVPLAVQKARAQRGESTENKLMLDTTPNTGASDNIPPKDITATIEMECNDQVRESSTTTFEPNQNGKTNDEPRLHIPTRLKEMAVRMHDLEERHRYNKKRNQGKAEGDTDHPIQTPHLVDEETKPVEILEESFIMKAHSKRMNKVPNALEKANRKRHIARAERAATKRICMEVQTRVVTESSTMFTQNTNTINELPHHHHQTESPGSPGQRR